MNNLTNKFLDFIMCIRILSPTKRFFVSSIAVSRPNSNICQVKQQYLVIPQ